MTKIPLRLYNHEIENLIDRGQTEEAIAHCRHILQTYPKYIDIYRLLGKAYLESQRYGEAADLFQRVLSVIPDDFVSHVGMSIIHEDEGNLDAAIWNMERAFEVQPSNSAIQEELRRLYGRRDGVEPPKVRLTRGALVRMYAKGNLYQQAIAELTAALSEDPKRIDLQLLQAQMLHLSDRHNEALKTCETILNQFPYCLKANQILANILSETGETEKAQTFLHKTFSIDPYLEYITSKTSSYSDIPDNAVTIEHLEWQPQFETDLSQTAFSAPSDFTREPESAASSFLQSGANPISDSTEQSVIAADQGEIISQDVIPEWLNTISASKAETVSQPEPGSSVFNPASENVFLQDDGDAALAEQHQPQQNKIDAESLPDWLKEINTQPTTISSPGGYSENLPEFSQAVEFKNHPSESEINSIEEVEGAMSEQSASSESQKSPGEMSELPDWLQELNDTTIEQPQNAPNMDHIGEEVEISVTEPTPASINSFAQDESNAIPEWLNSFADQPETSESTAISGTQSVDKNVEPPQSTINQPAKKSDSSIPEEPAAKLPDWLQEINSESPEETPQIPAAADFTIEDKNILPDWLNTLNNSLAEENSPSIEHDRSEFKDKADNTPDWLQDLGVPQGQTENFQKSQPEEPVPDWLTNLESIKPAESPGEQTTTYSSDAQLPDWLQSVEKAKEETESPLQIEEPADLDQLANHLPQEIDSMRPDSSDSEKRAQTGQLPDWLLGMEPQEKQTAQSDNSEEGLTIPVDQTGDQDNALAWLEALAEKQGAEESTLITPPDQRTITPPDWIKEMAETPSSEIPPDITEIFESKKTEVVEQELNLETPEILTGDETEKIQPEEMIPEWIQNLESAPPETAAISDSIDLFAQEEENLPDWLTGKQTEEKPLPSPVDEVHIEEENDQITETINTPEDLTAWESLKEEVNLPDWLTQPITEENQPVVESENPLPEDEIASEIKIPQEKISSWEPVSELALETPSTEIKSETPATNKLPTVDDELITNLLQEQEPAFEEAGIEESGEETEPTMQELTETQPPLQPTTVVERYQLILEQANHALANNDLNAALDYFSKLIKSGQHIEKIIEELSKQADKHPDDILLWQTIGDAFARANKLQDALNAYTKAEELIS
jgi:tetratricopeptide (TPR) repeat protein